MGYPDFEFAVGIDQVLEEVAELNRTYEDMGEQRRAALTPEMMFEMGVKGGIAISGGDIDYESYEDDEEFDDEESLDLGIDDDDYEESFVEKPIVPDNLFFDKVSGRVYDPVSGDYE